MTAGPLAGKRVLVTGAGGSIGSELCRQLAKMDTASLVMLDRDESGLHSTQLSIEGRALLDSRSLVVADIRDRRRLGRIWAEHRPDVVLHAAALKHLSLLEQHPYEAVRTNVIGTLNVLQVSAGAECVVNISTDKAADPTSVLGWSKRVTERLTAGRPGRCVSVRFGNVLGSRGSVLGIFQHQIEQGGPVTVTHPDVSRFMMSVEDAVGLVLEASALGTGGEVFVLDMGAPVRIADLAEKLIAESGTECGIVFTGLRPGEKLHEELFGRDESPTLSAHPLISSVPVPALPPSAVQSFDLDAPDGAISAALAALSRRP